MWPPRGQRNPYPSDVDDNTCSQSRARVRCDRTPHDIACLPVAPSRRGYFSNRGCYELHVALTCWVALHSEVCAPMRLSRISTTAECDTSTPARPFVITLFLVAATTNPTPGGLDDGPIGRMTRENNLLGLTNQTQEAWEYTLTTDQSDAGCPPFSGGLEEVRQLHNTSRADRRSPSRTKRTYLLCTISHLPIVVLLPLAC
eukprot:1176897-Prorocentrum_minimum.AAC.1